LLRFHYKVGQRSDIFQSNSNSGLENIIYKMLGQSVLTPQDMVGPQPILEPSARGKVKDKESKKWQQLNK
jgi:hypothetical protein